MLSSVPDLLVEAAARHRDRPALVMDGSVLTYADLDAAANRMACSLNRYGVGPDDRVALWLPKSIEAIVALWGVMKAGAAYVPIDPAAPAARMAAVARHCEIAGLITVGARASDIG